jgi:hypothetical protein
MFILAEAHEYPRQEALVNALSLSMNWGNSVGAAVASMIHEKTTLSRSPIITGLRIKSAANVSRQVPDVSPGWMRKNCP